MIFHRKNVRSVFIFCEQFVVKNYSRNQKNRIDKALQQKNTSWMNFKEQGDNKCDDRAANKNNEKRTENIVSNVNVT
jgi:hypothetical protein